MTAYRKSCGIVTFIITLASLHLLKCLCVHAVVASALFFVIRVDAY